MKADGGHPYADGTTIRRPRDTEGPGCRMLLPDPVPGGGPREFYVAVEEAPPRILGAVAFRLGDRAVFGLRLRVVRTHRRRGIGSRLLRRVIDEAARRGDRVVIAPVELEAEPDAEPFLRAHGFLHQARLMTVEAPVHEMRQHLAQLRRRLEAAGKIPSGARLVRFADAPQEEVARLYAQHIAGNPGMQPEVVAHLIKQQKVDASPVLIVDGKVEGMLLWSLEETVVTVHARVVREPYRGGWANALLMGAATEEVCQAGAQTVRFDIPGGNRDTLKLSRRFQAKTLKTLDRYLLRLGEAADTHNAAG
jgi:GNAT superfamily N-acetyltransferase